MEDFKGKSTLHQIRTDDPEVIKTIGDLFPGLLHINRKGNFFLEYMNEMGLQSVGMDAEELERDPEGTVKKHAEPSNLEFNRKLITAWEQRDDPDEILTFFQYVRKSLNHDYEWYFSMKKKLNQTHNYTLVVPVKQMNGLSSILIPYAESNQGFSKYYSHFESLTRREKEILKLICEGKTTADISELLHISPHTTNTHRKTIKRKLNADNQLEMVKIGDLFFNFK